MPRKKYSINIGDRFGRLVVLAPAEVRGWSRLYLCQCDCGKQKKVMKDALVRGATRSCGCYRSDLMKARDKALRGKTTHGMAKTRPYNIYNMMKERCNNPNHFAYKYYGGKGIKICQEWSTFEGFWAWAKNNGYKDKLTLDRINPDGDYSPDNCRWTDIQTQANNKTSNIYYTVDGKTQTEMQWGRLLNIHRETIASWRRRRGKEYATTRIEQALRERGEEETREKDC